MLNNLLSVVSINKVNGGRPCSFPLENIYILFIPFQKRNINTYIIEYFSDLKDVILIKKYRNPIIPSSFVHIC